MDIVVVVVVVGVSVLIHSDGVEEGIDKCRYAPLLLLDPLSFCLPCVRATDATPALVSYINSQLQTLNIAHK